MTLILDLWGLCWRSVDFHLETGKVRVRWLSRPPARTAGFAQRFAGTWYAVWNAGDTLMFQFNETRIPMTDAFACTNSLRGKERTFTIREGASELLRLTYDDHWREWDPTFDELDLELSDFFLYVARVWNDPSRRAALIAGWLRAGPRDGSRQA